MVGDREAATVVVDGVRLAYEEWGMGPPLLFVHGFGTSSHSWRAVMAALADSHRTVAVDLMGFGRSEKPLRQLYTMERQAALLRGFITQLDLADPVLVGHSYGGGVCLMLLRLNRDFNPRSLVLVDPVCYPQKLPLFLRLLRTPALGPLLLNALPVEKAVRMGLQRAYYRPLVIRNDTVAAYAAALRAPGGKQAAIATAAHFFPQDLQGMLRSYKQIKCPTLIIWGERDPLIPVLTAKRLLTDIAGARVKVLEGTGHVPQEEVPQRVSQAISEFLSMLPKNKF